MERFVRIEKLLGKGRAAWLRRRSVTIVGLGAVGGYALEGLARAGISHIRLVDFDLVAPSNMNRQILALDSTVGMLKVEVARQRVLDINPRCRVEALPLFADATNIAEVLAPRPDIVIDAIDSLPSKIELLVAACRQDIAVVSSMGAALRTDPSQVKVNDLFNTKKCPLARRLRKQLRQAGVGPGITCVYSTEDIDFNYGDPIEAADTDEQLRKGERPRRLLGSLPTLTGIFGLVLANTAIYKLLDNYPAGTGERTAQRL